MAVHDRDKRAERVDPPREPKPIRDDTGAQSVPVMKESIAVGTAPREVGAVRVRIETEQCPEAVPLQRAEDRVVVERVPVHRFVDRRQEAWTDGDVWVVPVYSEVPVLERRLMLVEELRFHRQTTTSSTTETVALTRERAVVERRQADGSWAVVDSVPGSP
jgi:stress response protein YsnF